MILPNKNIKKISVGAYFVLVLDINGLLYGTGENTVKKFLFNIIKVWTIRNW